MTWAGAFSWCTDFVCSHDGKPSNPKLMGWAIFWAAVLGRPLPILLALMLLSASFGLKTFQMYLQRGTWSLRSSDQHVTTTALIESVQSRRDPVEGIEPTL